MNYEAMLEFVKNLLSSSGAIKSNNPHHQFRDRYEHTRRVYNWAKLILSDFKGCNEKAALTAAIFHDVGYSMGKENHAINSAIIFEEYAKENNLEPHLTKIVVDAISKHSNKSLVKDPKSSKELILLLEADLLDEEGAIGIVWDLLSSGSKKIDSYYKALDEIYIHSGHILEQDYMVTPIAKAYWEEKKRIVKHFIESFTFDLFLEEK